MRSLPPYAHYPRTPRGSVAPSVTVHRLQDNIPVSVPGAHRFPRTASAVGAALFDAITTLVGMAIFAAVAWFFLLLA